MIVICIILFLFSIKTNSTNHHFKPLWRTAKTISDYSILSWILKIFVEALIVSVVLSPIKLLLPWMIAAINSIETNTHMPTSIFRKELTKIFKKPSSGRLLFHDDHDIDLTTDIVRGWGILHNHISSEKQQKGQKHVPSQKRCKAHSNNRTMNTSSQTYIEKRLFIFGQAISLPDCSFHASKIAKQSVDIQFISHQVYADSPLVYGQSKTMTNSIHMYFKNRQNKRRMLTQ